MNGLVETRKVSGEGRIIAIGDAVELELLTDIDPPLLEGPRLREQFDNPGRVVLRFSPVVAQEVMAGTRSLDAAYGDAATRLVSGSAWSHHMADADATAAGPRANKRPGT
jgi:hypothetical protein